MARRTRADTAATAVHVTALVRDMATTRATGVIAIVEMATIGIVTVGGIHSQHFEQDWLSAERLRRNSVRPIRIQPRPTLTGATRAIVRIVPMTTASSPTMVLVSSAFPRIIEAASHLSASAM